MKKTEMNSARIRNIFIICIVSTLMGQFYISPFNTDFRLTLVVFFISLFLLYFNDYNIIFISVSVGICTFLFRSFIFYLEHDVIFSKVIIQFIPVLVYYFFFGLLFKVLKIRESSNQPLNMFFYLLIADSIPNIMEISIRRIWNPIDFGNVINQIILIGIIRTTAVLVVYYWVKYYLNKFQESERSKYYRESIMLISKLKTELFFLKKSRNNIEDLVSYTHHNYETTKDAKSKASFLKIAKDIHEIKKDYLRVITGMDSVFSSETNIKYMSNKDIFNILEDNALKLIKSKNKNIIFTASYDEIFLTDKFYSLISILNNLIINSIDAIDLYGEIKLRFGSADNNIIFVVEDTGEGIPKDKLDIVFREGYTTKYDSETGIMSTGLGLAHVYNIVTEYFNGKINIESAIKKGTKISISILKNSLIKGE